jgi:hypothetical protein
VSPGGNEDVDAVDTIKSNKIGAIRSIGSSKQCGPACWPARWRGRFDATVSWSLGPRLEAVALPALHLDQYKPMPPVRLGDESQPGCGNQAVTADIPACKNLDLTR